MGDDVAVVVAFAVADRTRATKIKRSMATIFRRQRRTQSQSLLLRTSIFCSCFTFARYVRTSTRTLRLWTCVLWDVDDVEKIDGKSQRNLRHDCGITDQVVLGYSRVEPDSMFSPSQFGSQRNLRHDCGITDQVVLGYSRVEPDSMFSPSQFLLPNLVKQDCSSTYCIIGWHSYEWIQVVRIPGSSEPGWHPGCRSQNRRCNCSIII